MKLNRVQMTEILNPDHKMSTLGTLVLLETQTQYYFYAFKS